MSPSINLTLRRPTYPNAPHGRTSRSLGSFPHTLRDPIAPSPSRRPSRHWHYKTRCQRDDSPFHIHYHIPYDIKIVPVNSRSNYIQNVARISSQATEQRRHRCQKLVATPVLLASVLAYISDGVLTVAALPDLHSVVPRPPPRAPPRLSRVLPCSHSSCVV